MISKSDILACAQKLFNEKGYDYVSMREIAGNLNISVGNLTYHYKKKEDIFRSLLMENKLLSSNIEINSFDGLNTLFDEMLNSLISNRFFFINDKLSSIDNKFADTNIRHISAQKQQLINAVEKLQSLGLFRKHIGREIINSLISVIMLSHLEWCRELGDTTCYPSMSKERFLKMHWELMMPYLSEEGVKVLENSDFFKQLKAF